MSSPVDLDRPFSTLPDGAPPPRIQRALAAFEEAIGGRDALVTDLSTAQCSDKEDLAIRLLADPANDSKPLHVILSHASISVRDFLKLVSSARGQRAYLAALDQVWQRLPDVAADVMQRALPSTVVCKSCNATGYQRLTGSRNKNQKRGPLKKQWERVQCPDCEGSGRKPVVPTLDYQRLALTLGGLPKPIPGTQIDNSKTLINAQQQNFYGSDTMRGFIEAVARVKHGPAQAQPPIDAEPSEQEEV